MRTLRCVPYLSVLPWVGFLLLADPKLSLGVTFYLYVCCFSGGNRLLVEVLAHLMYLSFRMFFTVPLPRLLSVAAVGL